MSSDHMPLGPYALQPKKQRFFRFLIDESLLSNIPSQLNLDTFRRVGYGRIQSIAKETRKQVLQKRSSPTPLICLLRDEIITQ